MTYPSTLDIAAAGLGSVDTNRLLSTSLTPEITTVQATLQDFTVQDFNADGVADLVAVTDTPQTYFITFKGNGLPGGFAVQSGTGDNSGLYLGMVTVSMSGPPGTANNVVVGAPAVVTQLVAVDANSSGTFSAVAALQGATIQEYKPVPSDMFNDATQLMKTTLGPADAAVPVGLGAYYTSVASASNLHPTTGFGLLDMSVNIFDSIADANQVYQNYMTDNGFRLYGGDGGNSTIGPGGSGGGLGSGALNLASNGAVAGSISIVYPASIYYNGSSFLSAGQGGNGFTAGGAGGDINGVSSAETSGGGEITSSIQFTAGNGGNSVSGAAGRGGVISNLSAAGGTQFAAGNGGTGVTGGAGGSVIGNTQGVPDTSTGNVTVITGIGGSGLITGGAGGNITNFDAEFLSVIGGVGGSLTYDTGPGGSAAGGTGGAGGSISGSSPNSSVNSLAGDITLFTGAGGTGLNGGAGGAITNFVNQPTSPDTIPSRLNVIAGNGGIGLDGIGGAGGTITNFQSDATGLESGGLDALSGIVRIIAGVGGDSYSATGGTGGSIVNSTALSTSTPIVVAAGAGGEGLLVGGLGGSVTGSVVSSAAQEFGKVLIIAGAGGDATAVSKASVVIPGDSNTSDLAHALLAMGGADGMGGNGGSIGNFTQPTGSATAVDLIAGNGGSTLNAGSPLDVTTGVGVGGSIDNINLVGTVGSITRDLTPTNPPSAFSTNPPIKSYTDLDDNGTDDETIAAFVQSSFGGFVYLSHSSDFDHSFIPNNPAFMLDDAAGNVGIVAGRAGQVKGGQGASDGVNGSVQNVTAGSILSIVAGSVNDVAPVQLLSGIVVTNPDGVLGADKSTPASSTAGGPNGTLDYYDTNGNVVQNLAPGYRLIDGALYAETIDQPAVPPFIAGPRVFSTVDNGG